MQLPPSAPKTTDVANEDLGFVTLFNGLDLTGWTTGYASTWTAGGNVLHCKNGSDTLTTTKTYGPYELIVDYKLQEEDSTAYIVVDGLKADLPTAKAGTWNRYTHRGKGGYIGIGGSNASFTNIFSRPLK
jgi:hypothetical protein